MKKVISLIDWKSCLSRHRRFLISSAVLFSVSCLVLPSCTNQNQAGAGHFTNYERVTIPIQDEGAIAQLNDGEYTMLIEASLSLPDTSLIFICDQMKYDGGYYFLKENGKERTIWVYDSLGNYVSKLGEKGRAMHEYQTDITDWFYLPESEEAIVFERNSRKIHTFSVDGTPLESRTLQSWPHAIGVVDDINLFCSYYHKMAKDGIQLGLISKDEDVIQKYISLSRNMDFVPSDQSFYLNQGWLYHIPSFADSAIVFDHESVDKVVKFSFEAPFITEEIKREASTDKLDNFLNFQGIQYVNTFYETSRYYYLQYAYSGMFIHHLIDKTTQKQYKFSSGLAKGFLPSTVLCVRGSKLYYLITKNDIDEKRHLLNPDVLDKMLLRSEPLIQRIFNGEERLPLILSVEIAN